jgi:hypothetical protein
VIRAWVRLVWNSLGASIVAAAGQLGVADALGIIRWSDTYETSGPSAWSALLTWVGFIYAVAVLAGAAAGRRAAPRRIGTTATRVTAAASAAAGSAAAVTVARLLSRDATPPVSGDPELVVTITAGAGVLAGLIIALLAMSAPPIAGGVRAAVAWIWLVGIGAAAAGIASGDADAAPRLAVLDAPSVVPAAWWSGPYAMAGIAAILGFAVAGVARWGGAHRLGVVLSGFAGPAVVAAAYLIAGPGEGSDQAAQSEPYRASLIAAGAGLCAALLVGLPGRRSAANPADHAEEAYEAFSPRERGGYGADPFEDRTSHDDHGPYEHQPSHQDQSPFEQRPYEDLGPYEQRGGYSDPGAYEHGGSAPSVYRASARPVADHIGAETVEQPVVPGVVTAATSPAPPAPSVMGQPPRAYQEEYADWLKDLGKK